ncbi:hypothetical protein X772_15290 [Mesorhizobium sp. LSJC280B00]|nr:hypothetical protein X772_15290 [Mesorhizobium sp. LSJC280B00]
MGGFERPSAVSKPGWPIDPSGLAREPENQVFGKYPAQI